MINLKNLDLAGNGLSSIVIADATTADLAPGPIPSSWILEGDPKARGKKLLQSYDRTFQAVIWDCTAGRFNWHYDVDETVFIISGEVFIDDEKDKKRRLGPGDMGFFPAGSHCMWHIPVYVRKFAILRNPIPGPIAFFGRAWNRLVRTLTGSIRPWSWLQSYSSNFGSRSRKVIAGSLVAMAIIELALGTLLITVHIENRGIYQAASAPTTSGVLAVRFATEATAADIATFLESHKGIIVEVPRPGGFYRVRLSEQTSLSLEDLRMVAARMAQDPVVDLIAVPQ